MVDPRQGEGASALRRATRPSTATDYVSDSLRRAILTGELESGTRLSLTDVASTFEVSTTPAREALRALSFEGLVTIGSYKGGIVTAVSRADVEEVVRIRRVLEPLAIEEAMAGMTSEILAEAEEILSEMEDASTWDRWVDGNGAFHQKLYEAAASRRLVALIKGLQDTIVVFMSNKVRESPMLRDTAGRDHRQMLECARAGDSERLIEITLRHLAIPLKERQ